MSRAYVTAGADPQATVVGAPVGQLGDPGQVEEHPRADAVEVELDHQVRAARDRHRIRMRGLELERLPPAVGLQHFHVGSLAHRRRRGQTAHR